MMFAFRTEAKSEIRPFLLDSRNQRKSVGVYTSVSTFGNIFFLFSFFSSDSIRSQRSTRSRVFSATHFPGKDGGVMFNYPSERVVRFNRLQEQFLILFAKFHGKKIHSFDQSRFCSVGWCPTHPPIGSGLPILFHFPTSLPPRIELELGGALQACLD